MQNSFDGSEKSRNARIGFISAARSILKLRPGALATAGVPCGSYIFLNCPTSGRRRDTPLGREHLPYIMTANKHLS